MHEGRFTEQIVDAIIGELKNQDKEARPTKVSVRVGEIFHLVPDSVLMHFEVLAKGTELEGVVLDLTEEPVTVYCEACQKTLPVEDHHVLMCPECSSFDVKVKSGENIEIQDIVFET